MKITINNEALALANGVKVGDVVTVADKKGVPLDKYWRNRIKDAKTDNCVTVGEVKAKAKENK